MALSPGESALATLDIVAGLQQISKCEIVALSISTILLAQVVVITVTVAQTKPERGVHVFSTPLKTVDGLNPGVIALVSKL